MLGIILELGLIQYENREHDDQDGTTYYAVVRNVRMEDMSRFAEVIRSYGGFTVNAGAFTPEEHQLKLDLIANLLVLAVGSHSLFRFKPHESFEQWINEAQDLLDRYDHRRSLFHPEELDEGWCRITRTH